MKYTIEDIKRLCEDIPIEWFTNEDATYRETKLGEALITTHAQLEVAREALERVVDDSAPFNRSWVSELKDIAREALAKIEEMK